METDCPLRILIVEDLPSDAELAERELHNDGVLFTSLRVETKEGFLKALEEFRPDLIISDYAMPEFDGMQALQFSLAHDPHLPFILLTGSMNEETAVACMKAGATDYIIKEHIARLPSAVRGALEQQQARLDKEETAKELIAIYENAPLIMMLMDGDGGIHKANDFAAAFSGRSADAMLRMRCGEALHCLNALASPEGCGFGEQCKQCIIRRIVTETLETGRSHHHVEGSLPYGSERQEGEITFLLSATRLHIKKQPLVLVSLLDITDRKRGEEKLQDTLKRLRNSVSTTIQVMASAVEARDPYTAGHQIRSANLARTIATEMELPQDKIDGIRMAGSIHDIGKLSIPAEILSKPTKLSAIEFSLIREHANRGFEILKGVESSWPLAEIVYQHHERMDGSGYPRNLKGEEICMEARILAVADVVEAMASHRPYRPALGLDAALEEIEKNRGVLYDAKAVEVCLRLFREKGFSFEEGPFPLSTPYSLMPPFQTGPLSPPCSGRKGGSGPQRNRMSPGSG